MAHNSKDYDFKTVGDGQSVGVTVYWGTGGSGSVPARPIGEILRITTLVRKKHTEPPPYLALLFHGGAFIVGTRSMIPPHHIGDLVAARFVVASADYSLLPQAALYEGAQQDAKDAYRWCKDSLPGLLSAEGVPVDGDKVVVVGYSAGATLALVLVSLSRTPHHHPRAAMIR